MVLENSLLIVAKGQDEYLNNDIKLVKSIEEAKHLYGEGSQLAQAYEEAVSVGNNFNIYLCNAFKYTDYIAVLKHISRKDFKYITPLFDINDKFKSSNGNSYYLAELYSNSFLDNVNQIILTGEHAEQFEDSQHFIDSMTTKINEFKINALNKIVFDTNLCFVANNLKDRKYANVILASLLLHGDYNKYPVGVSNSAVFELRNSDFLDTECIFFSNSNSVKNAVVPRNLVNMKEENTYEKSILNNAARREIILRTDASEFEGSIYSNQTKISIENFMDKRIQESINHVIEDGELLAMDVTVNDDRSINLSATIKIKPFFFLDYVIIRRGL